MSDIQLSAGADKNGLAVMVADLLRQNLEAKPHKRHDFDKLKGSVCIVAEDAEVSMTLRFDSGKLTIHDGITGIPDVTIRTDSDTILALSNIPLHFGLPLPDPRDRQAVQTVKQIVGNLRSGKLAIYGALFHFPMMSRLTRVMSVNG